MLAESDYTFHCYIWPKRQGLLFDIATNREIAIQYQTRLLIRLTQEVEVADNQVPNPVYWSPKTIPVSLKECL